MNEPITSERRDLVILGGGLVGMTLALAAARAGLTAHVVDRADPADLTAEGADGRASAISTASWNLFANIGLSAALDPLGCPIEAIAVTDGMLPDGVSSWSSPRFSGSPASTRVISLPVSVSYSSSALARR